jgi:hypothetical protein
MRIEDELELIFMDHRYTWMIDDQLRIPNAKDIRMAIDEAKRVLSAEPEPKMSMNVGRLHIEKTPRHWDVYVLIGDDAQTAW